MLSRKTYIYAAARHRVITYLLPKDCKLLPAIPNGQRLQVPEYKLRRMHLFTNSVEQGLLASKDVMRGPLLYHERVQPAQHDPPEARSKG